MKNTLPIPKDKELFPGPGEYPIEKYKSIRDKKQISFPHGKRFSSASEFDANTPGMGTYEIPSSLNLKKSFSFGGKHAQPQISNNTPYSTAHRENRPGSAMIRLTCSLNTLPLTSSLHALYIRYHSPAL